MKILINELLINLHLHQLNLHSQLHLARVMSLKFKILEGKEKFDQVADEHESLKNHYKLIMVS